MGNSELIGGLYGFDWVAVDDRERGLAASAQALAPDVKARISPEVGDRVLHGVQEFAIFIQGLEEDFSEFRYEAHELAERDPDRVVVRGRIRARGRHSNMPLSAPFVHVWTMRDGKAASVEAHVEDGA